MKMMPALLRYPLGTGANAGGGVAPLLADGGGSRVMGFHGQLSMENLKGLRSGDLT